MNTSYQILKLLKTLSHQIVDNNIKKPVSREYFMNSEYMTFSNEFAFYYWTVNNVMKDYNTYLVSLSYSSKDIQQSIFLLMMALPVDKLALVPAGATDRPWG